MRLLTTQIHQDLPLEGQVQIEVLDEPDADGACHYYRLGLPAMGGAPEKVFATIHFQDGDRKQGINGITPDCLLAILEDYLGGIQKGPMAKPEDDKALKSVESALKDLNPPPPPPKKEAAAVAAADKKALEAPTDKASAEKDATAKEAPKEEAHHTGEAVASEESSKSRWKR